MRVDRIGSTEETLEDILDLSFRDTNAGITYLDADLPGNLIERSRDGDGSTHLRIFYRIGEQILEYQIHHRKIGREGMLPTG